MKRINPKTQKPFKCGDVRADGYIFLEYRIHKIKRDGYFSEVWLSPNSFSNRLKSKSNASKIHYSKNFEKYKAKGMRWRQANPERQMELTSRWRKTNPKKQNAFSKTWRKANPHKVSIAGAKRRAQKLQRTPKWLNAKQLKDIEYFYILAKSIEKQTGVKQHVDHIVPLQGKNVSGLHVPWNLQILTEKENLQKGSKF